jgi:hypothetical protein
MVNMNLWIAHRLTADKREIRDFPKFACRRTSFIRKTLCEIGLSFADKKD